MKIQNACKLSKHVATKNLVYKLTFWVKRRAQIIYIAECELVLLPANSNGRHIPSLLLYCFASVLCLSYFSILWCVVEAWTLSYKAKEARDHRSSTFCDIRKYSRNEENGVSNFWYSKNRWLFNSLTIFPALDQQLWFYYFVK